MTYGQIIWAPKHLAPNCSKIANILVDENVRAAAPQKLRTCLVGLLHKYSRLKPHMEKLRANSQERYALTQI